MKKEYLNLALPSGFECIVGVLITMTDTFKNCDKILLMRDGKIIEEGNHTELISSKGEYYELIHS